MPNDDDSDSEITILKAWAVGPQHALERLPRDLQPRVLRYMLSKLEKKNTPKRPRRKRASVKDAATSSKEAG
jgi:hypothetical protein